MKKVRLSVTISGQLKNKANRDALRSGFDSTSAYVSELIVNGLPPGGTGDGDPVIKEIESLKKRTAVLNRMLAHVLMRSYTICPEESSKEDFEKANKVINEIVESIR